MNRLNVELYGVLLGTLTPRGRGVEFTTIPSAFEHYPVASTIMSLAVPLSLRYTAPQRKRGTNFFTELLPEGRNLRWLTQTVSPEERSAYGLLRKYGKDSAGALLIYDPEDPTATKNPKAEKLSESKIRSLFEHMPQEPLANAPLSGKTSLGGMQGKIVLSKKDDSWYRGHFGHPSTHILKPSVPEFPTMIYDEAFCMQMAYEAGLTSHPIWIESFDGSDALVIERFDRDTAAPNGRIHQEDFNQALGAQGEQKYQEIGGKVTAKRIAQTLERFGAEGDVQAFAAQLIFAVAIGNLDMHAKNVSIFHFPDATIKLTPTYDQVPLRHQNTDGRMALAVGGEYVHANLTRAHIANELLSWQHVVFSTEAASNAFISECLESYRATLEAVPLSSKAYPALKETLSLFMSRLLSGKPTGKVR